MRHFTVVEHRPPAGGDLYKLDEMKGLPQTSPREVYKNQQIKKKSVVPGDHFGQEASDNNNQNNLRLNSGCHDMVRSLFFIAALGVVFSVSPASAATVTLFSDNFDRTGTGNSVGNSWTEYEAQASDVAISNRSGGYWLMLRDYSGNALGDAVALQNSVSTQGGGSTTVKFNWQANSEADTGSNGDKLYFAWRQNPAGSWNISSAIFETSGSRPVRTFTSTFTTAPGTIAFRLFTDITNTEHNEGFYVDNFTLTGERTVTANPPVINSVPSVPEPSTWAMMLIGFAGLGYAGYRRRKQQTVAQAA